MNITLKLVPASHITWSKIGEYRVIVCVKLVLFFNSLRILQSDENMIPNYMRAYFAIISRYLIVSPGYYLILIKCEGIAFKFLGTGRYNLYTLVLKHPRAYSIYHSSSLSLAFKSIRKAM